MSIVQPPISYPLHKATIVDTHAPPILNQWYTVINLVKAVAEIKALYVFHNNTETQNQSIEYEAIIDGETYTNTINAVSGSLYCAVMEFGVFGFTVADVAAQVGEAAADVTTPASVFCIGELRCHSFRFRYRITNALGTAQTLDCRVSYGAYP